MGTIIGGPLPHTPLSTSVSSFVGRRGCQLLVSGILRFFNFARGIEEGAFTMVAIVGTVIIILWG